MLRRDQWGGPDSGEPMQHALRSWRFLLSGAVAGAVSAAAFAALHQFLITNIWFSIIPMMIAGALCGLSLAGTYRLLFSPFSLSTWLKYNTVFVALLGLLAIASLLIYEPITTIPALLAANRPPRELFRRAMPLTVVFTLGSAVLISLRWGRTLPKLGSVLLTCTILILLLGLNVSAIGLVQLPSGTTYLVAELFGFILALDLVYGAGVFWLERRSLLRINDAGDSTGGGSA